jgi:EmrB/QacA subfamily drug resistance transporter
VRARVLAALAAEENRKWWTLAAVAFGLFMIMLDNTVVNVALPSIQRDLHVKLSELEWIVTGYALTFAALLITGGKLGDLYGRRRIFVIGIAIFTLSSLACGLAPTAGFLIGARIVQGVGAALMNPASLSIITATFPPRERGQAIGIWAGVSAMALAIGPLVGGLIVDNINWNWIFFINVPVGVVGIVVSRLVIRESRDTSHEQSVDLPGLVTSSAGLFALTYALIEGNRHGWTSAEIVGLFAAAAVLLVAFVVLERYQRLPMLDLSLFRNGSFTGANLVAMLVSLGMFGVFFFVSLYIQNILGWTPTQAGASFLPMTILIILVAPAAGKLSDRVGSRWLMGGGMTLVSISLLLYQRVGLHSTFWTLLPAMLLGGVGMAMTMSPMTAAAMSSVPVDKAGVGSGVLNSFRQLGGSLGIALMGAILASFVSASPRSPEAPQQFVNGLHAALLVAAAITFAAAIVAVVLVRTTPEVEHAHLAEIAA